MRISDWSSDVCSSDLDRQGALLDGAIGRGSSRHRGQVRACPEIVPQCHRPTQTEVPELYIRSEEHTSELQSLMRISYAVFCLKKKNITRYTISTTSHTNLPIYFSRTHFTTVHHRNH